MTRIGLPRLLALACALAALPAAAMQTPGGAAPPAAAVEANTDWRAEMNAVVAEENHWRWRLRSVERRGDTLVVGVSYRNGATTGRPIFFEADYMETTALVDADSGARFAVVAVDGISEEMVSVDSRKSKLALFTFPFPEDAGSVTFTSRWMSMQMAGFRAAMEVDFPIDLPPAGGV